MRELSLFSGAGGGLLATKWLLGWTTVAYVEINEYCQRVLRQRIDDNLLDDAPIYGDIRAFTSEGYADAHQGVVDVVTGGFPCQPFSVAGKQRAGGDERNMWPETMEVIRRVRPRWCLLENVPGLRARRHNYFERVLQELAESGYDARWDCLPASAVGAPHRRDRLFIVAHALGSELRQQQGRRGGESWAGTPPAGEHGEERHVADATGMLSDGRNDYRRGRGEGSAEVPQPGGCGGDKGARRRWWLTEPDVGRVAHGVAPRVDRLRALGNGQVPLVVARAWELLSGL